MKLNLIIGLLLAIVAGIAVAITRIEQPTNEIELQRISLLESKIIDLSDRVSSVQNDKRIELLDSDLANVQSRQDESNKLIEKLLSDYAGLRQTVDAEKAKFTALQAEIEPTPDPIADFKPCNCEECCESLKAEVEKLKADFAALKLTLESLKPKAAPVVKSEPKPAAKPAPMVVDNYSPRWHNNDGLTLHDHITKGHGINGATEDDLERAHDAWHDKYGPNHPSVVRGNSVANYAMPSVSGKTVTRSRSVQTQNCPNGQCPTGRTTQPRLFRGWFR